MSENAARMDLAEALALLRLSLGHMNELACTQLLSVDRINYHNELTARVEEFLNRHPETNITEVFNDSEENSETLFRRS